MNLYRTDDQVLAINSSDVGALNNKASVLKELKNYDDAIEYYDKALVIDP